MYTDPKIIRLIICDDVYIHRHDKNDSDYSPHLVFPTPASYLTYIQTACFCSPCTALSIPYIYTPDWNMPV